MRPRMTRYLLLGLSIAVGAACTSPPATNGPHVGSSSALASGASPEPAVDLPEVMADKREQTLAEIAMVLLPDRHLLRRPIDDSVSKDAFPRYLEALDGAKLLLLQEHADLLGKYADRMDDQLRAGDLSLARKGAALVARRRKEIAQTVAEILSKPFDFNVDGELETDAEKRKFAKTEDELKARWRDVLKLQVLERIQQMDEILEARAKKKEPEDSVAAKALGPIPTTFEGKEEKARKELATRYETRFTRLADMESLEPAEQFINAIASAYDPHTTYLAPSEKENFDIAITGQLQGIGAALGEQDHYVVVQELIPGGASWNQGKLAAGDLILAVAQEGKDAVDVTDMPLDKVVSMIRGPKGTIVTLTVKKPEGAIETISIKRDIVKIEATYARGAILERTKGDKVGYVHLPGFYGGLGGPTGKPGERNATDDVRAILESLKKKGVQNVIVDLRGNGGGILSHARDISGLFIPKGPVVQARASDGDIEVLADGDPSVSFDGNVVVLVDRFSASAAEILAGALQDYERAVIVGTSATHGKGTVQAVVELDALKATPGGDSLGVLKLTTQQYFRVNGASTQWRGVAPDILLPDPASFVDSGERTLPHSIPWTSVEPVEYKKSAHQWKLAELLAASQERVKKQAVFGKVETFGKLVRARREDTTEPLKASKFFDERKKSKAELEAADPKLADTKPLFQVSALDGAAPPPPPPSGDKDKKKNKLDAWKDELARDPWVDEAISVLGDMAKKK